MTNETKEFAIIMNFDDDLAPHAIYGFSDEKLAVEAMASIQKLGISKANMIVIQTKRGFGE